MKFLPLLWAGLFSNRLRTLLTFLSIAIAFLLLGLLHGVSGGFDAIVQVMSNSRLWIQSRAGITHPLPLSQLPEIEKVAGITSVVRYAYVGGYYRTPQNQLGASALDVQKLVAIFPEIQLPAAQVEAMARTRTGAIIGADLVDKYGWKIGDRIPIVSPMSPAKDGSTSWAFDVVGIYRWNNRVQHADEIWVNYDYFDEARAKGKSTVMMYTAGISDAAKYDDVCRKVDALLKSSPNPVRCQSERDWYRSEIRNLGNIAFIVNAVIGAVLFTLLALTAHTMMQSVRERIAQLAILKTLGFTDATIAVLVTSEALVLCLSAALCGLVTAAIAFPVVFEGFSLGAAPPIPLNAIVDSIGIAVAVALVSATLPALRALRLKVVDALAAR